MSETVSGLLDRVHRLRRRLLVRRRGLAALAAGAAVFFGISATTAPPPRTVPVWTAARDLPSGTVLAAGDLRAVAFKPGSVPDGVLGSPRQAVGRTLAVPVGHGQPLAVADVAGPGMARGYPGRAAVPVRITDPAVAGLLRVGDHICIVASDPADPRSGAQTLAPDAAVVALPAASAATSPSGLPGRLAVVAVPPGEAETVATASASLFVTVLWLR